VEVFPDDARNSKAPPGLEEGFYGRMTDKLLDTLEVGDSDFRQLAASRAQAVKAYLIHRGNVDSSRLYLTEAPETLEQGSQVVVQLQ
jgi:hypothetical protein